jgi:hypothetical protein
MTITLSADLTAALAQSSVRPVALVSITTHNGGTVTHKFTNSSFPLFGYHNTVTSITPISRSYDPFEHTLPSSEMSITFIDDGYLRAGAAAVYLYGKPITVHIGTEDIDEADFVQVFSGVVEEFDYDYTTITMMAKGAALIPEGEKIAGAWANKHPLGIVKEILDYYKVPSGLIDSTIAYDADTTRSHWVVRRGSTRFDGGEGQGIYDDTPAEEDVRHAKLTITVTDYSVLEDTNIIFRRWDIANPTGVDTNLAESDGGGSTWNAQTDNDTTAENIKNLINLLSLGIATRSGAVVTVIRPTYDDAIWVDADTAAAGITVNNTFRVMDYFSNWIVNGVTKWNSDPDGSLPDQCLHVTVKHDSGTGLADIKLWKDDDEDDAVSLVAQGASQVGHDTTSNIVTVELEEKNDSGISGSVQWDEAGPAWYKPSFRYSYIIPKCPVFGEEVDPIDALQQLATIMGGMIYEKNDGKIAYKKFDPTAAVSATLTPNDISNLRPVAGIGRVINRCVYESQFSQPSPLERDYTFNLGFPKGTNLSDWGMKIPAAVQVGYTADDATSQSRYSYDGVVSRVITDARVFNWLNGVGVLKTSISDSSSSLVIDQNDSLVPYGPYVRNMGMCGTAGSGASRQAHSTRPIYLYIPASGEIIRCEGQSSAPVGEHALRYDDPLSGTELTDYLYYTTTYSSLTRAQKETKARAALAGSLVYDITIHVALADQTIARFKYGCPIIEVDVPLSYLYLELGDLVSVEHLRYLGEGYSGLGTSNTVKWEITAKTIDITASPPKITLQLTRAAI